MAYLKPLKDLEIMKQQSQENEGLNYLKEICEKGYNENGTKNVIFLRDKLRVNGYTKKKTNPKHEKCAAYYKVCDTEKREKSICRCMFYYDGNKTKCRESCKFKRKWHYVSRSDIKITDYETPMKYKIEGIGNIDLRIIYKNEEYGVEVKPPENNEETICRMLSEAMTYTIDFPYKPAIAVFGPSSNGDYKGSYQYKRIQQLIDESNDAFSGIREKYVKVFVITVFGDINAKVVDFTIEPLP